MREIKVRGYSIEKLITDTQWLVGFGVYEIKFADHYAKEVGRSSDWWIYTDGGEYLVEPKSIGQYTGLKDKNGKEIYEGDIVNRDVYAFGEIRTFTGQVKMFECAWWIDTESAAVPLWNEIHELEVIGNIYENPELINS